MPDTLSRKNINFLPQKAPAALKTFASRFFARTDTSDLDLFTPEALTAILKRHWSWGKERKTGATVLNVATTAPHEGKTAWTAIDIIGDDMAFLIDSVAAEINRQGYLIACIIHPIIGKTSHIHVRLSCALTDTASAHLREGLEEVLRDVRLANRDWPAMLTRLKSARNDLSMPEKNAKSDQTESCAFLDYMIDNNFTLLGYREYRFSEKNGAVHSAIVKNSGLGVLSDTRKPAYISGVDYSLPDHLTRLRRNQPALSISKTNRRSTIHRAVPMDTIAVKIYAPDGTVKGERLFVGLFTSVTYSRSVEDIPWLRAKVDAVVARTGFKPGSHNWRALKHVLEKYPRDELFQIEVADLEKTAMGILGLQERQRIALHTRRDPFGRYVSCLVYVPRDRYETRLRLRLQTILENSLKGTCSNFYTTLDDSVFARVLFVVQIDPRNPPQFNPASLEARLQEEGRTWSEQIESVLTDALGRKDETLALHARYREAFPIAYQETLSPREALRDIDVIEKTLGSGKIALDLRPFGDKDAPERAREQFAGEPADYCLKICAPAHPVPLSDILPILENSGLRVVAEIPYEMTPDTGKGAPETVWLQDFHVSAPNTLPLQEIKAHFESLLEKTWFRETENDSLNQLVLSAALPWRDIMVLRCYVHYLRQINYPFSRNYIRRALTDHPTIARRLVSLFYAQFDPANRDKADMLAAGEALAIDHDLESVESGDQDRILRMILSLIESTVRTNFFQTDDKGQTKPYLSIKMNSRDIPDLPEPRPFMEIFVYSPRMEGIHLRGDKIARGGIRWSDRPEDFRTEILGLMKAQMVKNAIIVPVGAKGGFVLKAPPADPSPKALRNEAIACYQILICGLLDLTDNRIGNRIVPPPNVVRRDEDDPYLVVAADKGTASFSDIANALSAQYGFWLADAFASGGSSGYDHKHMGITAKGAWESVKRHFREINHDTQTTPFDVIGVGDMAGDVFGNGMILSDKIRLVGAFNHVHIFCDPDPDPSISFAERKRLFDSVLGWDHYDLAKLSPGGRIYVRSDKNLLLTPEIKKSLDFDRDRVTPAELIRALLRAPTDLLWFGGIGTYVKSSRETHADVGDKSNDSLRISAPGLRARVIGEGANLAMTQRARIEYAEKGGRLNTDFVDNSGGVDCSDHEVNIKILLAAAMAGKDSKLTLKARNRLLESMTDEVSDLVLHNNYQQTQALSLAELAAAENIQIHGDFIADLEREHGLRRDLESLPDEEALQDRIHEGKGLTRPELAILLSHAKILFTRDILDSNIPDSPDMATWLFDYFPAPLRKKYEKNILAHRLGREIVATSLANDITNRMGPTFVKSRMLKTGCDAATVARAFLVTRTAFDFPALWAQIESLDGKVPAQTQLKALENIIRLARVAVTWFLTHMPDSLGSQKATEAFCKGIKALRAGISPLLTDDLRASTDRRFDTWKSDGLPESLAKNVALLPVLSAACDIVRISMTQKTDVLFAGRLYFALGARFHFDWLRRQARHIQTEDRWKADALEALVTELYTSQAALAARILADMPGKQGKKTADASKIVEEWLSTHDDMSARIDPVLQDMRRVATLDLPMLVIAEQRLRNLYES